MRVTGGGHPGADATSGSARSFQPSDPEEETHRMSDFFVFQRKTFSTSAVPFSASVWMRGPDQA